MTRSMKPKGAKVQSPLCFQLMVWCHSATLPLIEGGSSEVSVLIRGVGSWLVPVVAVLMRGVGWMGIGSSRRGGEWGAPVEAAGELGVLSVSWLLSSLRRKVSSDRGLMARGKSMCGSGVEDWGRGLGGTRGMPLMTVARRALASMALMGRARKTTLWAERRASR